MPARGLEYSQGPGEPAPARGLCGTSVTLPRRRFQQRPCPWKKRARQPASAVSSMYEQSSHLRFAFDTYESCTTGGGRYVPCARRVHAVCDHYRTVRNHAPVESGNLPLPVAFLAWRSTASLSSSCCVRSASLCARVLCVASRTASHERDIASDVALVAPSHTMRRVGGGVKCWTAKIFHLPHRSCTRHRASANTARPAHERTLPPPGGQPLTGYT